ncbi:MAG: FAD-binding protein [Candidatus Muirbacterium halophilum]|nr:FAD-binding protein [Candidatus Muirbacterium halophilum]MCK9475405.1 FAD-binding protein [Candidatus Muirbacterium halophilum]
MCAIECIYDIEIRKQYSKDKSSCKAVIPKGVFFPKTTLEVSEIVKKSLNDNFNISIWGAGSGVNGGAIPQDSEEFVISLQKMDKVEILEHDFIGRAQCGVNTLYFQQKCEEKGLFFPPDPASADISSIGGNLACSAGGMRGYKYGTFRDYVIKITFVDGKGNIITTGCETFKWVTGYDFVRLLTGSEGTLGIITEASFKLIPGNIVKTSIYINFESMDILVAGFLKLMKNSIIPSNAEFMDSYTLNVIKEYLPCEHKNNGCVLLLEIDSYSYENLENDLKKFKKLAQGWDYIISDNEEVSHNLWKGRKRLRTELEKVKPNVFSEDFVLLYSKIPDFIRFTEEICNKNNIFFCNFGHIIDGNIHFSSVYENDEEKRHIEKIIYKISEYVISNGGTISGEHGIGKYKRELMIKEIGQKNVDIMQSVKKVFDPHNILNKGKIF